MKQRTEDGRDLEMDTADWEKTKARSLLKRLLPTTGRRADRSTLLDDLWPNQDADQTDEGWPNTDLKDTERYLNNAVSKLRKVFRNKDIIKLLPSGYQLAGASVLRTDIDQCQRLMEEAEVLPSADAIPLLEKASEYFDRGEMLEGEDEEWACTFRKQQEDARRYCHLMLARSYEVQKKLWHARNQYERLFEISPIDEEALCFFMGMLSRHDMVNLLRSVYEEAQKRFKAYGMSLSRATKELFEHLMQQPVPFAFYTSPPKERPSPPESERAEQPQTPLARTWPITYNRGSQLSTLPLLEKLELLMQSRRQALRNVLRVTGSTLLLFPNVLFPQEGREHLERAMVHSSYLDEKAIDHLAAITQTYWDMRETTAALGLVDGITGHFLDITRFLKESRPTPIYKKLGALASETAQLLARTFDEMREYDLAWDCYAFALSMAQEIRHADLWASGAVRLAELLIEWGEAREALPFLEAAQKRGISDQRLRVWLSTVETKIYAMTGNMDAFLRALARAKHITLPMSLVDDIYRTDFDPQRVAGYEGVCLMWLKESERALPALNGMLARYDPTSIRPRSLRLAEIGRVHGQLGEVKKACELLLESLSITAQTKSLVGLQRIYQGRAELEPWKKSGEVKELDARIIEVYRSLARVKERV